MVVIYIYHLKTETEAWRREDFVLNPEVGTGPCWPGGWFHPPLLFKFTKFTLVLQLFGIIHNIVSGCL